MDSIITGSEQPCNHQCAYPEGAPARRQSAAGGVRWSKPLSCLPKVMQEVCCRAQKPNAGLQSSTQKCPLVR